MASALKGGVLEYIDEQIDALHRHVPGALEAFDAEGIHQARVATRRLKAALDVLAGETGNDSFAPLNRAGRKLRRLLGPLRDADVMVEHVGEYAAPERLKPALAWLAQVLAEDHQQLHANQTEGKSPEKRLRPFGVWWSQRPSMGERLDSLPDELRERLASHADAFAAKADQLAGISSQPPETPLDVHELRIEGKILRYTFELAAAEGVSVPKRIFKAFKAMQESLGTWHDYVVLAEATTARWAEKEIALHNPELAGDVLDLAKLFLKDASKALAQFKSKWRRSGRGILKTIHELRPIDHKTKESPVSESETGPRLLPQEAPTDPASPA
jgi:CHAD domain-containing protein